MSRQRVLFDQEIRQRRLETLGDALPNCSAPGVTDCKMQMVIYSSGDFRKCGRLRRNALRFRLAVQPRHCVDYRLTNSVAHLT